MSFVSVCRIPIEFQSFAFRMRRPAGYKAKLCRLTKDAGEPGAYALHACMLAQVRAVQCGCLSRATIVA